MRRTDTLHSPWPEHAPGPDGQALANLVHTYRGRWIIWRAMSPQRHAGDWCARRAIGGVPAGLSAATPEGLRERIEEADR